MRAPATGTSELPIGQPRDAVGEAELTRKALAEDAGVGALAAALAADVRAMNTLEEMLVAQLSAAYRLAMTFSARSDVHARNSEYAHLNPTAKATNTDHALRFANASAKMMLAFNDGVRTLERFRNGGRQTVVVQRVNVSDGGQAVISAGAEIRREGGA